MKPDYPNSWIFDLRLMSFDGRYATLEGNLNRGCDIRVNLDSSHYPHIKNWRAGYYYLMRIKMHNKKVPDLNGNVEESALGILEFEEELLEDKNRVSRNTSTFTIPELEEIVGHGKKPEED